MISLTSDCVPPEMRPGLVAARPCCLLVAAAVILPAMGCSQAKHETNGDGPDWKAFNIRWLGTAGYEIHYGNSVVLIDPFLTRPGPTESVLLDIPLISNTPLIDRTIQRADCILISHGHYDHLMDAPYIARRTQATLYGSQTAYYLARSHGLAERQLHVFSHGEEIKVGRIRVTIVDSRHSRVLGLIPNDGVVDRVLPLPLSQSQYKMGGAYAFLLDIGGYKVFHNGSADFIPEHVETLVGKVDMLILGIAGWQNTPGYVEGMLALTRPKILVPTHHDNFFLPFELGFTPIRDLLLDEFVAKVESIDPQIEVLRLKFFEWHLQPIAG